MKRKKIELHLHLDGSLRAKTVRELGIDQGLFDNSITLENVENRLKVNQGGDLRSYLKSFDLPIEILQTKRAIERVSFELLEDLYREGTIYCEIRVAPIQHVAKGLTPDDVVKSILKGFIKGQNLYPIKANLLLCAMRHLSEDENMFLIPLADKYRDNGVVGLDLAGNEADFPPELFSNFFKKALEHSIPFTIHAGEASGAESVISAIDLGAKRIGHGLRSFESSELIERLSKGDIHLEMCPQSNIDTSAIDDFNNYPILDYLKRGISVSLNSDNRTVSSTNIDKEIKLLKDNFDITEDDIKQLTINAIDAAFISSYMKEYLKEQL